mgnify:CR=1 FL=1
MYYGIYETENTMSIFRTPLVGTFSKNDLKMTVTLKYTRYHEINYKLMHSIFRYFYVYVTWYSP